MQYSVISKFDQAGFLKFFLVFVSRDLELGGVPVVSPSQFKVKVTASLKFPKLHFSNSICSAIYNWQLANDH